jgi:hypothetical protein
MHVYAHQGRGDESVRHSGSVDEEARAAVRIEFERLKDALDREVEAELRREKGNKARRSSKVGGNPERSSRERVRALLAGATRSRNTHDRI